MIEPPETCDDGNTIPGDGCSPLCLLEVPNLPPVCDGAFASPDALWPPNHKFVPIGIDGVRDPDGDPIAITVTAVAQDEPVDAEGDGSTCGDASGLGTDVVLLRSERSGNGDGRVYHVAFRADDPAGGFCIGEVDVCVRHDNGHGGVCGDQGPLFDSTPAVCVPATTTTATSSDCVPPPPIVIGDCDDVPLPPLIEHRLDRTRRLLERAAVAGPARQRRLAAHRTHPARPSRRARRPAARRRLRDRGARPRSSGRRTAPSVRSTTGDDDQVTTTTGATRHDDGHGDED